MVLTSRPYCLFSVPHMAPPSRPVGLVSLPLVPLVHLVRPAVPTVVRCWYSRSSTYRAGAPGTHLDTPPSWPHMVTVGRGCEVTASVTRPVSRDQTSFLTNVGIVKIAIVDDKMY